MNITWAIVFCLATFGCASKGNWKYDEISSGSEKYDSSRISYVLSDTPNSLQIEIIQTKESCKGYLCVHSRPIPSYPNDPKHAKVSLQIGEDTIVCLATRHEGGHRLSLPEEIVEKILKSLKENQKVLIDVAGYRTRLDPEGFQSQYQKSQKNSLFSKFFRSAL